MTDRTTILQALVTIDECIRQTVERLAEAKTPKATLKLVERLDKLDTGKLLLGSLLDRCGSSTHI